MKRKTKRTRTNRATRHAGRLAHLRRKSAAKAQFAEGLEFARMIDPPVTVTK